MPGVAGATEIVWVLVAPTIAVPVHAHEEPFDAVKPTVSPLQILLSPVIVAVVGVWLKLIEVGAIGLLQLSIKVFPSDPAAIARVQGPPPLNAGDTTIFICGVAEPQFKPLAEVTVYGPPVPLTENSLPLDEIVLHKTASETLNVIFEAPQGAVTELGVGGTIS